MAGVWKRDGTVAVTNGSKKVTGTGTTFADAKNGVAKGHLFCMTTGTTVDLYEVDYVVSNTELHLVQAFRGTTGTGKAYEIITTFSDSIPEFARKLNASLSYYQSQSDMVQQLFTSDAAEITVTAPDGTTHKLIPWKRVTSEGEGQAARAKVEADRSRDEANRAKDEADRAAGIVAAAALPLPDVWAPLTDSLRLFTGYGREVKVGDDVIARYVNYSRSTAATYSDKNDDVKVAAINEPRFERNGLLIDGQSTNIWWSQVAPGVSVINAPLESVILPTGVAGNAYKVTPNPTDFSYARASFAQQTGQFTLSCFARRADGSNEMPTIYAGHSGAMNVKASGVYLGSGWWRMYVVMTNPAGNTGFGFAATTTDKIPVHICFFQLEALPFVSSYIPTNGAAVARSADLATLPQSLNLGESQLGFSLAVEFDSVNTGAGRLLELSDLSTILTDGASVIIRHAGREVYGINAPLGQRHHLAYSVAADGALTVALNGKLLALQSRSGSYQSSKSTIALGNRIAASDRAIYGHLRDLKIWTKKPLTADQLKVASA
ncbi:phage head spike fiber domain-containing protein [Aeromonas veronii]|uniref:phage head spike fiber domain-containing protein n=1 Tax=Aeromonas veronii TaxID=654 RepID=UPI0038B57FFA